MKKTSAAVILTAALAISCATSGTERLSDGRTVYKGDDSLSKKDFIEGVILDSSTKKGIGGAIVEIKNANLGVGYYKITTDSSGRFKIDDFITQIRYVIEIAADGYVTYKSTDTISPGKHEIFLDREGILTGSVSDSSGSPLRGIDLRLYPSVEARGEDESYESPRPIILSTDDNGKYSFNKLRETSYTLTFEKPGFITETAVIQQIKKGETFTLPMTLYKPASISGKLKIEGADAPAINIAVVIKGRAIQSAATFQDGSYIIDDIKPGKYETSISHPGFAPMKPKIIQVNEGVRLRDIDFSVKPKAPAVSIYAYRYTFTPGMKVEFSARTFRLEKIRARIYSVPMGLLVSGRTDPNSIKPSEAGFATVREWEDPVRNFEPYEWRYQSLDLGKPLPTGGYCVEISGAGMTVDRKFFTVTSVGMVVKRSRESVFAYVTDLVTNKPLEGVKIALFDNTPKKKEHLYSPNPYMPPDRIESLPLKIIDRGVTDKNGVFHHRLKTDMHISALAVGPGGSYSFCSTGSPAVFAGEMNRYFIYTDRPVYRAGDTVFYKIIGKKRGKRFAPISGAKLFYKIINADVDASIDDGDFRLDDWGTHHGSYKLDADARLGEHTIMVGNSPDALNGHGKFYVEQYRKPEFKIDITPSREYFTNGDTAEFKIDSKYFFGAPLKGAMVKYRFFENRLRDTDTVYWWEEDYGSTDSYNRIVQEGDRYADENGIVSLQFNCGNFPYDREITLEVTAVDKSNVSITSRKSVRVGRGEFYIKINPYQNFFADDESKSVTIRTLTHGGEPISRAVNIQLFRYIWKPWQRVYVHEAKAFYERKITTDSKGAFKLELPEKFDSYGEFDLVASAVDKRNNTIKATRVIWVYSHLGAVISSRFKNLEMSVSKTELDGPAEVTCLVKSRFSGAHLCLTLEGRDIYESRVVMMKGNVMPVKFSIKSDYAPNLFITATMQKERALFTATAGVTLPNPDTSLKITVEPAGKKYKPGEKAVINLKVSDEKGNPVAADLSLGSVDEAIYQIRHDHTPKMRDFFYSKISNWVLTNYSYPITLLAGAGKDGKVKIREKFEDTAFWKPDIRTDKNGKASVSFTLPDNLTTWRLTVRGHDLNGRVGENRNEILVTQDLIARIGKPRFLVEGDRVSLIGIINSNTKRGLEEIKTDFRIDGKSASPDEKIRLSLPAFGSASSYYTITVPEGKDKIAVQFTSEADKDAKDGLRVSIPVESKGSAYRMFGNGDMLAGRSVEIKPIASADNFDFKGSELRINVNPNPVAKMLRATDYLAKYPYSCIEQTINRFIPLLVLKKTIGDKVYISPDENLEDGIRAGLGRIEQAQNDDGSWGWWSGDRGNEFLTAYVMHSLHTANKFGFYINKTVAQNGINALGRMLQNSAKTADADARAYLLFVNTIWLKWDDAAFHELLKAKEMSTYQLSFLIRTMSRAGQFKNIPADTKQNISRLLPEYILKIKDLQKKDGTGLYWESRPEQVYGWQGGAVEMSAHVLSALVESGDTTTLPSQIVSSLSKRGRGDSWNSTKETATVIYSICSYLEKSGIKITNKGDISFSLDGKNIADFAYDTSNTKMADTLTKKIKLDPNLPQKSYTVTAAGSAGPDVSFDITLSGNIHYRDGGFLSIFRSEEGGLKDLENGITISRGFNTIMRVRDINNSEYLVPQGISDRSKIRVGDEILVRIRFRARDNFEYLVLEDYLPSGFEVVNKNAYDETGSFSQVERRDNRMVYFFTKIRKGEVYEIAYIIRAELPGNFIVKPARIECMYEPSIQGWSKPARFEVEKK